MDILDKLHVNPRLDTPLVLQLKEQLTWLIVSGQIQPGESLPAVRQAAARLGINLHTVRHAYLKLAAQGLVETHQGMATRVLPYDPLRFSLIGGQVPSHMLGVIIPNLENPLYTQYIRGVESIARPEHSLLLVCDAHDEPEEALLYFRKLVEKRVDGILVFSFSISGHLPPGTLDADPAQAIPFVTVDWSEEQGYNVVCDFESGTRQALVHLLEDGHRRIGLIAFAMNIPAVKQIQAGYQQALMDAGLAVDESLIAPVYGFDMAAGEEATRALLHLPEPPTAIFAMSDLLAIGALSAIRNAGLRVPKDIALAGVNDIPLARLVDPPLTTVHQPAYEMGKTAMEMLQQLIAGQSPTQRQVNLPTALVIRQSCGPHR
jgi:DNA-binding LacI/PurR family transcriptional regulator